MTQSALSPIIFTHYGGRDCYSQLSGIQFRLVFIGGQLPPGTSLHNSYSVNASTPCLASNDLIWDNLGHPLDVDSSWRSSSDRHRLPVRGGGGPDRHRTDSRHRRGLDYEHYASAAVPSSPVSAEGAAGLWEEGMDPGDVHGAGCAVLHPRRLRRLPLQLWRAKVLRHHYVLWKPGTSHAGILHTRVLALQEGTPSQGRASKRHLPIKAAPDVLCSGS